MSVPKHELNEENHAVAHKRKFSFSIGYAFAWALLFEGLFSTLYHLCPSKLTFQFDAAFMFVVSGLIAIVIYNGIEFKNCQADGKTRGPVGATNFFLGFIVPLYFLNYLGSLNHSKEGLIPTVAWAIPLAIWCFMIINWVGYKLYFTEQSQCNFVCFILGLILAIGMLVGLTIMDSLPQALLLTCISECVLVIARKAYKNVCRFCCNGCDNDMKSICAFLYILVTFAFVISAVVMFLAYPTTDKADTPEKSRNKNHECVAVGGFFDYHDLWHILSSFALLMGAHLVMYISYEPTKVRGYVYGTYILSEVENF